MQLSPHFKLAEFTKSQKAIRNGIPNRPRQNHIAALKLLCEQVLEPVRQHFGKPVFISSGYRSPELNRAVGGSTRSQHRRGEAADFEIPGVGNREVAIWIRDNIDFDQLILEGARRGNPNAGWIHVSCKATGNRGKDHSSGVLTATFPGPRYTRGID